MEKAKAGRLNGSSIAYAILFAAVCAGTGYTAWENRVLRGEVKTLRDSVAAYDRATSDQLRTIADSVKTIEGVIPAIGDTKKMTQALAVSLERTDAKVDAHAAAQKASTARLAATLERTDAQVHANAAAIEQTAAKVDAHAAAQRSSNEQLASALKQTDAKVEANAVAQKVSNEQLATAIGNAQKNSEVLDRVDRTLQDWPPTALALASGGPTTVPTQVLPDIEFRTLTDLDRRLGELPATPSALELSACLAEVDGWIFGPQDEAAAEGRKGELVTRLRTLVRTEVRALQARALQASTGADASTNHAAAGQILALYPMSDDPRVLNEARGLAANQAEVAVRIEVVRRQRYNRWATSQVGEAIDGFHSNSSYLNPLGENINLMNSLVGNLAEIDPALLEPAVLELYNYVWELTKKNISEKEAVELAQRMTAPSIRRKTLGDF